MVPPVQPISFRSVRQEFRPTLRLALPLVLAEIGWMSMGVVDTIMVGRLPNSAIAIGATGLGQSLYHSVAIFGAGLLLGMDTFVAQAHGREDICDARHSLVNGVFLALVLTPVLMVLVWFWPMLMQRFGVSQLLVGPMRPFLSALNWGTLPLLGYFALRRYLQAVHVVRPIMFALISANVVNFVGDWVLIYGHLGFPAMGIRGSGWSTCLARVYMALVMLGRRGCTKRKKIPDALKINSSLAHPPSHAAFGLDRHNGEQCQAHSSELYFLMQKSLNLCRNFRDEHQAAHPLTDESLDRSRPT